MAFKFEDKGNGQAKGFERIMRLLMAGFVLLIINLIITIDNQG